MSNKILVKGFGVMTREQAIQTIKDNLTQTLDFIDKGDIANAKHLMSSGVVSECLNALTPNLEPFIDHHGDVIANLVKICGGIQ